MKAQIDKTELVKQQRYADDLSSKGFDFGMAVGSAFVESMRNTYYRHSGTAIDELIDNSIEAGARNIHICFGYDSEASKKPESLAIIDNGHGMIPNMIRLAPLWGGTHREGQRSGFGRFGFGLPSASVNQCKRYTVFSKTADGVFNKVTIDLDDIREGKLTDKQGRIVAPEVKKAKLPKWLQDYLDKEFPKDGYKSGTIILWEKLDRISWKTTAGLRKNLAEHLGTTFRNYIGTARLVLDGMSVEPVDPLFGTPEFRYFDHDEDRAIVLPPKVVPVKIKETGEVHEIRVRFSRFPLRFFTEDKSKTAHRGNRNPKWAINEKHRGLIVTRMGRQIDVLQRPDWVGFPSLGNNDRYWSAELDFPAALDEEFSIANSKQGVIISERIWQLTQDAGVPNAIHEIRRGIAKDQHDSRVEADEEDGIPRPSERSMKDSEKFDSGRTKSESKEREARALEELKKQIEQRARQEKKSQKEVELEISKEEQVNPYQVHYDDIPGGPFFRAKQIGGIFKLFINRSHRFYSDLYASSSSNPAIRSALELLLFVLSDCELDAEGNLDKQEFYRYERIVWSNELEKLLSQLATYHSGVNGSDLEEVA